MKELTNLLQQQEEVLATQKESLSYQLLAFKQACVDGQCCAIRRIKHYIAENPEATLSDALAYTQSLVKPLDDYNDALMEDVFDKGKNTLCEQILSQFKNL